MQIKLVRATDLKPTILKNAPSEQRDEEQVMAFIEVYVLGRCYVGPIAAQGSAPTWDWTFFLPAESIPTDPGAFVARFTAYNFMARSQPQVRYHRRSLSIFTDI
jgi:hypothetical protein